MTKKMPDVYIFLVCIIGTSNEVTKQVTQWIQIWGKSPMTAAGIGTVTHNLRVDGNTVNLIFFTFNKDWTTQRNRHRLYSMSSTLIIAFDKGEKASFNAVKVLYKGIPQSKIFPYGKIPIVVVGFFSKSEEITTLEGQNLAEALGVDYYETKPTDKEAIEEIVHDLTLKVLKRNGVSVKTITTPEPPSEQEIQKARQIRIEKERELVRKLIYENQLSVKIDIILSADTPPEEVAMHKELWQEYQDRRITIYHNQNDDD